jgi:hypothetical protein
MVFNLINQLVTIPPWIATCSWVNNFASRPYDFSLSIPSNQLAIRFLNEFGNMYQPSMTFFSQWLLFSLKPENIITMRSKKLIY